MNRKNIKLSTVGVALAALMFAVAICVGAGIETNRFLIVIPIAVCSGIVVSLYHVWKDASGRVRHWSLAITVSLVSVCLFLAYIVYSVTDGERAWEASYKKMNGGGVSEWNRGAIGRVKTRNQSPSKSPGKTKVSN